MNDALLLRHARPCAGHPRLIFLKAFVRKDVAAGTSPAVTWRVVRSYPLTNHTVMPRPPDKRRLWRIGYSHTRRFVLWCLPSMQVPQEYARCIHEVRACLSASSGLENQGNRGVCDEKATSFCQCAVRARGVDRRLGVGGGSTDAGLQGGACRVPDLQLDRLLCRLQSRREQGLDEHAGELGLELLLSGHPIY